MRSLHRPDSTLPLRLVADVALPGTPSRLDYQDVDPVRRRSFVVHLGASRIDVVDLDSLRVVGTVEGVGSVHGVRVAPDIGRVFASATASNEVLTIDAESLAVLARAPTGAFPDGLATHRCWCSTSPPSRSSAASASVRTPTSSPSTMAHGRLYVAAESGVVAMFAVEGRTLRKLGQQRLAAKAHTVRVDPTSHRVFFPLESVGGHPELRVMAPT